MIAYLDYVRVCSSNNTGVINCSVNVAPGSHRLRVTAWDSAGNLYQSPNVFFSVTPPIGSG